jgi:hypothetical protein
MQEAVITEIKMGVRPQDSEKGENNPATSSVYTDLPKKNRACFGYLSLVLHSSFEHSKGILLIVILHQTMCSAIFAAAKSDMI